MKRIVLAATGASGAIYLQRLLDLLALQGHELHLIYSTYARQVIHEELGALRLPENLKEYSDKSMSVPFASGSTRFDAMVICPCSMGTLGRIAAGTSENTLLRAADVFLKERRPLVLVPRETPWNRIHARNVLTVMEAGAIMLPAMPSFYNRPTTLEELADTLVWRILSAIGCPHPEAFQWKEDPE